MRKKLLTGSAVVIIVLITVAVALFVQAPSNPIESSPPEELPAEGTPPNLLVIPEVSFGTIAILIAMFGALVIFAVKKKRIPLIRTARDH